LIRKWLRAGILQPDGAVEHPERGTPQGSIISPILVNIYLQYVLDLWFEQEVKKNIGGKATMVRYADDFVVALSHPFFKRKVSGARPPILVNRF
jgi:retron-type reverse transcriptase